MAIPDHVKRQAMDAVNDKTTTALIRLYSNNDKASVFNAEDKNSPAARGPIPEHVKKQAMDAIDNAGTRSQIRMVETTGAVSSFGSAGFSRNPSGDKISKMHDMGHGVDKVHGEATKDSFAGGRYG